MLLQATGYRTAEIGLYLNGSQPGQGMEPGWDAGPVAGGGRKKRRRNGGGKGKSGKRHRHRQRDVDADENRDDEDHVDAAVDVIAETAVDQPLYLHVGFGTAHVPVRPKPPYAGQFARTRFDRDPSFAEEDVGGKPRYIRDLRGLRLGDEAWLDRLHQGRLETLLELDEGIVEIWDALEARGRLDTTYVYLLSDNGMALGHHRYYGKIVPYDRSVRAPLHAFGPGFAAGAVDKRLVGNIDLAPTLVEIAEAAAPQVDGASLLSSTARDAIMLEMLAANNNAMPWPGPRSEIPPFHSLRIPTHLYTEYRTGKRELYDYASDPYEVQNLLAGDPTPDVQALAAQLAARLDDLRDCDGTMCA
jgi:N-acetylglucosamine-6-sulfatase